MVRAEQLVNAKLEELCPTEDLELTSLTICVFEAGFKYVDNPKLLEDLELSTDNIIPAGDFFTKPHKDKLEFKCRIRLRNPKRDIYQICSTYIIMPKNIV